MLDPNYVRESPDAVKNGLSTRCLDVTAELQAFAAADAERRRLVQQVETLKREQNASGGEVAKAKKQGLDASHLFETNKARGQHIKQLEAELEPAERRRLAVLETLPNIPHASVPVGKSSADNVVVRTWGEPRPFDF